MHRRQELQRLALDWEHALDAAERAIAAAVDFLSAAEVSARRHDLARERKEVARTLKLVASTCWIDPPRRVSEITDGGSANARMDRDPPLVTLAA